MKILDLLVQFGKKYLVFILGYLFGVLIQLPFISDKVFFLKLQALGFIIANVIYFCIFLYGKKTGVYND